MNKKYLKKEQEHRPPLGMPYRRVAKRIADKFNETAIDEFRVIDVERHAIYELWRRVFPNEPFPHDADVLRRKYHADPNTVQIG